MKERKLTSKEELINSISHGIGFLLSIAALVILLVRADDAWEYVSFGIFGATLVIFYLCSTIYHSITHSKTKRLFRIFDHIAIFLLIAGSYTPFVLISLRGALGWSIFGIVWGIAAFGIVFASIFREKKVPLAVLYLFMGWFILIAIKPLFAAISLTSFILLVLGGIAYTVGVYFLANEHTLYFHNIWHGFVLLGSILHFSSIFLL